MIKKGDDVIVNVPLNVGVIGGIVGAVAAPWAMITAAIAAIGFDCKIELVKDDGSIVDASGKTIGEKAVDVGAAVVNNVVDTSSKRGNKVLTFPAWEIKSLKIDCKIFRIHVIHVMGSVSDEIVFRYINTGLRKLKIKNESGNMEVSDKAGVAIYEMFSLIELTRQNELIVEIPKGFSGLLTLEGSSETVMLDHLDVAGDVSVWTTASRIECRGISGRNIALSSNTGSVRAEKVQPQNRIYMATTVGAIECSLCGNAADYQLTCQSEHGICDFPQSGNGSKLVNASSVTGSIHIVMSE